MSVGQIAVRAGTMCAVAAMIWLVGDGFFCVIGLVGGTCNNAMIFIFPPWFYLRLVGAEGRTAAVLARMGAIIVVGVAGMTAAMIGAVDSCS